jgi:hypothetical protein
MCVPELKLGETCNRNMRHDRDINFMLCGTFGDSEDVNNVKLSNTKDTRNSFSV